MNTAGRNVVVGTLTAVVAALLLWKLHRSQFDWRAFWAACRSVDWRLLVAATLLLWTNFLFRAARWRVFLNPTLPPGSTLRWWHLAGSQFIGFAGLAALGRIGELIRPYLVSRRTGLPFPSQVAVVAVERVFDLGAFGVLFAGNLLVSSQLSALPYSNRFHLFGYATAALMVVLGALLGLVLYAGAAVARAAEAVVGRVSQPAGTAVATRILQFRDGLKTVGGYWDFLCIAGWSLLTWGSIAGSYVLVCRGFPQPVHGLSISHVILLLGFSVVGGVVQLPGIGGGAQVLTVTALTVLFRVPKELATSTGILLWAITSMSVILPGLLLARKEQVTLRSVARQSGAKDLQTVH